MGALKVDTERSADNDLDLCNAADELDEEDRQAELLPILAQQLYIAIQLGKEAEATKIAEHLNVAA